jgi:transcriptional regulator with XRE-family HTH domain
MTDKEILSLVGRNVRKLRLRIDVTQEELASRAGLHTTYISGVERGRRNLTIVSLFKLAEALEVSPSKLLDVELS